MPASLNSFPPYLPILFFALAAAWWTLICFSCSILTGWFKLSNRFSAEQEPSGPVQTAGPFFYSVYMRCWSHYSCIVCLTTAEDALYLSVVFPFRIGHPPLRIPWNEVQVGRTRFCWRPFVALVLGNQERIPLRISERMAGKLGILERLPGEVLSLLEAGSDLKPAMKRPMLPPLQ